MKIYKYNEKKNAQISLIHPLLLKIKLIISLHLTEKLSTEK